MPDPDLPTLAGVLGKGYLLPAPVLPRGVLAYPRAADANGDPAKPELPIAAIVYDREGNEVLRRSLGRLPRGHATALDLDDEAGIDALGDGYGHVELVYDFSDGGEADGWLHAIFRYRHRASGHAAETSFGAHVFNTILTYRDEPQSYSGRPPGLSTRLFLRLGESGYDTMCHLIYPASRPWRPKSATEIILYDRNGARNRPREAWRSRARARGCGGTTRCSTPRARARAGSGAYAIIRDPTCRLFGYHGLLGADGAFSLDHMFGF